MDSYEIDDTEGTLGRLFIKTGHRTVPKWADFFREVFNPRSIGLETKSSRAVLLVPVEERIFCLTFGHAHFLIDPFAVERNFGLKVALNIGGEKSLRSVDKTSLEFVEIKSKEQSSKEVGIGNFDFDFETDILKSITAKSEGGDSTLSGRDSVNISVAIKLDTLREYLTGLFSEYESDAYKDKFSWVDNISEERDKTVIEQLNQQLIEKVVSIDSCVWLAIPEVIVWEDISGFAYRKRRRDPIIRQDIHLDVWASEIIGEDDEIDINYLKRKKIFVYDVNHELKDAWSVYHCLNAEIDLEDKKYILNDGSWYSLHTDFVSDVNNYFKSIEDSSVVLPPFGTRNEPEYNHYVATSSPEYFCLMDRKNLMIGGGRSSIEFCDLLTSDNVIIHLKKYGGSSVLSHLFQQGVVSGELFLSDVKFREMVNEKLCVDYKLADTESWPDPTDYEVCYAIMSDIPGELHIPFFSKVVMKNAVKRLQAYGYKVTKKKVFIS
jgi:uncharacterized protein (TIGR04141 family)